MTITPSPPPRPKVEILRHHPDRLVAKAESLTEPGRWHTVTFDAYRVNAWACSCVVGIRKRGRCIHVEQVQDVIAT